MKHKRNRGLLIIAVFKLSKGLLLLILAIGILRVLHRDAQQMIEEWINMLRIDPGNRYAASLVAKAGLVDDRKLEEISAFTFVYAALFLTEGVGLFLEKRWAEWLSVIATASFLPLEIYEIFKHLTIIKVTLLIGNLAIVWFLILNLRRKDLQ